MNKLLTILPLGFLLACNSVSQQDISELQNQKRTLEMTIEQLQEQQGSITSQRDQISAQIATLQQDKSVLQAMQDGKKVRYVLKVSIRQIHYSISIKKQLADMVNEEEFSIYTDKDSYDDTTIGSELFNSFRTGSAIMKGSLGTWRLKVVDKHIETN